MAFKGNKIIWIMFPLGCIHWLIVAIRNKLYDYGMLKTQNVDQPVVSIGNIQMGGTGKTPMVLELLRHFSETDVGVLTRGYGRSSSETLVVEKLEGGPSTPLGVNSGSPSAGSGTGGSDESSKDYGLERGFVSRVGDEPALIYETLNMGALGIGADRFSVGREIVAHHKVDFFLLDDGFQHRKLHRDLDICLIDVSSWAQHPLLFPFSYLRDVKSSLARADIIILTKFEGHEERARQLQSKFTRDSSTLVCNARYQLNGLSVLQSGQSVRIDSIKEPVAGFCGIANPEHFWYTLENLGLNVTVRKSFKDHHIYTVPELLRHIEEAMTAGATAVVVTEKDAVKLRELDMAEIQHPIYVAEISFVVDGWEDVLRLVREKVGV